mmetsp:Transcript_38757/g.90095  ORF Transcript_38757/g.90095 Transcript_38757/m.90095 type:complete len:80 (-) Transcript_38757:281-520(-)
MPSAAQKLGIDSSPYTIFIRSQFGFHPSLNISFSARIGWIIVQNYGTNTSEDAICVEVAGCHLPDLCKFYFTVQPWTLC